MAAYYHTDEQTPDPAADRDEQLTTPSRDQRQGKPSHAAPEGAGVHPLIDLSRDPNPGVADHARLDDEDD